MPKVNYRFREPQTGTKECKWVIRGRELAIRSKTYQLWYVSTFLILSTCVSRILIRIRGGSRAGEGNRGLKVKTANYEQQLKWATKSDPRWLIQKCMTITTVMNGWHNTKIYHRMEQDKTRTIMPIKNCGFALSTLQSSNRWQQTNVNQRRLKDVDITCEQSN